MIKLAKIEDRRRILGRYARQAVNLEAIISKKTNNLSQFVTVLMQNTSLFQPHME